jgi:hypothetical protein
MRNRSRWFRLKRIPQKVRFTMKA